MLNVKLILRRVLLIHPLGIPIPLLRLTLRPPVRPDSKFSIPIPVRKLIVLFERFPRRFHRPLRHRIRLG